MPGYIIHLTEAKMILEELRKRGCILTDEFEEEFLSGTLLPDTKRKREKVTSHFWREEDLVNLAIAPNTRAFEEKYAGEITSPVMYGYWAHLRLDEEYVKNYWPSVVTFLGEDHKEKVLAKDITKAYLHQGEVVPIERFFSSEYYYGDYDRTNRWFYERFQLKLPVFRESLYCPVTEVDVQDLKLVLAELDEMLLRDRTGDTRLRVLEEFSLIAFLKRCAEDAAEKIGGKLR